MPGRARLTKNPSALPLSKEEITLALSNSSPSSAPGPNGVPYSVWKRVNLINPTIIIALLSPLVAFGYHPLSLKTPNRVVLDKPGKACYDSSSSFCIIFLLTTISKVLERVMTVRLSAIVTSKVLLYPDQCGSLPGLRHSKDCIALIHEVRTLQRPRQKASTLYLDIKVGFDKVNALTLRARLLASHIPCYMVDWVSSFVSERTCTLVFPQQKKYLASDPSVLRPDASDVPSAFSMP